MATQEMIYKNLAVNEFIWKRLQKLKSKNRIPHALLFHGPNGSGKEAHAIELAALINCEKESNQSCGNCSSCLRIKNFSDENIHFIYPMPRGKITSKKDDPIKALSDSDLEYIKDLYKLKSKNPYKKIKLENSRTIIINSITNLKRKVFLSSSANFYKVIIIFEADKLSFPNNEAANSLLKILEEPPEKTCFILISSSENKVIDTIKSRCQSYYFSNLTKNEVKSNLELFYDNKEETNFVSALSNGDMSFAQNIIDGKYDYKLDIQHTIRAIYKKDIESWSYIYNKLTDRPNKNQLKYYFSLFRIAIRDIRIYSVTKNSDDIHLKDYIAIFKKFVENRESSMFDRCLDCVNISADMISRNGYKPIVVWTMLLDINSILNYKESGDYRYINR